MGIDRAVADLWGGWKLALPLARTLRAQALNNDDSLSGYFLTTLARLRHGVALNTDEQLQPFRQAYRRKSEAALGFGADYPNDDRLWRDRPDRDRQVDFLILRRDRKAIWRASSRAVVWSVCAPAQSTTRRSASRSAIAAAFVNFVACSSSSRAASGLAVNGPS